MQLFDLYVIYRGGQTIFHKRFGEMEIDQDLITAFLTAIDNFSKEVLANDEPLRVIEKGFSKVVLTYGKDICCALVCGTEDATELGTLRSILERILGDIQIQYAQILEGWRGDLKQLSGISIIVETNLKNVIRLSAPPALTELLQNPNRYYFTVDDRGINLYNTLLRDSRGFRAFIKKLGVPIEMVDMVLNEIRADKRGIAQLGQGTGVDLSRLLTLLRSLKLRGITLIWM
jgi:hypothetical protein